MKFPWQQQHAQPAPVGLVKFESVSMSTSLASNVWVIKHKRSWKGRAFFYSEMCMSFTCSRDQATYFSSEEEARRFLASLEVQVSSGAEVVNLLEHIKEAMAGKVGKPLEDWKDLGLVPPEEV